jgi:type IV secretion system protein VirB6
MSCAPLQSGSNFLGGMLAQVDCQAQAIGAYGYGALADPNSPVAVLLLAALTLFIALYGLRLMFGEAPGGRDVVGSLVKVGIVLTLATSWPAWRTVAYQVVLDGPSQIASQIGLASGLPGSRGDLNQRLENADQGIVALTAWGTGRLTGGVVGQSDQGDISRGIALADRTGFAWGRIAFLVGTVGPIAIVRLSAGILLALAPRVGGPGPFAGLRGGTGHAGKLAERCGWPASGQCPGPGGADRTDRHRARFRGHCLGRAGAGGAGGVLRCTRLAADDRGAGRGPGL